MAKDSADDILELTDIVEEGTLPTEDAAVNSVGNSDKKEPSFEDELDALFGDVDSNIGEGEEDDNSPIDPHEKLDMPDMSDLDSLLEDLDGDDSDKDVSPESDNHVEGVDELLADILPDAPAALEDVMDEVMQGNAAKAAPPPAADLAADDLDDLLAEVDAGDGTKTTAAKPVSSPMSAPAKATEPVAESDNVALNLNASTVASVSTKATPAAKVKPVEKLASANPAPESIAEPVAETAPELEDLDALIDDIMAPGPVASTPAESKPDPAIATDLADSPEDSSVAEPDALIPEEFALPEESDLPTKADRPDLEAGLADLVNIANLENRTVSPELAISSAAPEPAVSETVMPPEPPAPSGKINLEDLARQLTEGPLLAAIHTMVVDEVKNHVAKNSDGEDKLEAKFAELEERLETRLNEVVDKSAAAAAARIIREEIAGLLQDL